MSWIRNDRVQPAGTLAGVDAVGLDLELRTELATGEQLLWSGRPRQGVFLRLSDALVIPFSLAWAGFAVFWTVMASSSGGAFGLFGIPFVIVGAYIVVGRFFADAAARARTIYAVTDRRLLVVRTGARRRVQSVDLANLGSLELKEQAGGRATIVFGSPPGAFGAFSSAPVPPGWPGASMAQRPTFDSVEDGRLVYEIIRDASHRS